jgi:hypothetical protein
MTPARPLAASVAALGIAGAVGVPAPATAAPAPCERAERYAAQSGAELLRLNRLTLTTTGGDTGAAKATTPKPADNRSKDDDKSGHGADPAPTGPGPANQGRVDPGSTNHGRNPARQSRVAPAPGEQSQGDPAPAGQTGQSRDTRTKTLAAEPGNRPAESALDKTQPNGGSVRGLAGTLNDLGNVTGLTGGSLAGQADRTRAADEYRKVPGAEESRDRKQATKVDPDRDTAVGEAAKPAAPEPVDDIQAAPDDAVPPAGGTVRDVRIGEAKSALVAVAAPNSAAVTRMLNSSDKSPLSEALVQQAPPTNAEPSGRDTPAAEAGPVLMEAGSLSSHARWLPGMACGTTAGQATRAVATLGAARVMGIGDGVLVAVPEKVESVSTTALQRTDAGARTVARATMEARAFELLDGAVKVKVVRPPVLETRMSIVDGGEVSYVPAALEVSGEGIETAQLDTTGDTWEFTFSEPREESGRLPAMDRLPVGPPLTLPGVSGLPSLSDPKPEAAAATGAGTRVRIALGDVRQATLGHSVAARAGAVKVSINSGGGTDRRGPGYDGGSAGTLLDLELGVLESAAVAPEPAGSVSGGVSGGVSGAGGGLPLTGPRVDLLAIGGVALLGLGAAAMVFGVRRRRFRV